MSFWKYVASRLKSRVDIPKAVTALEKAEALNTFQCIYREKKIIIPPMGNNFQNKDRVELILVPGPMV